MLLQPFRLIRSEKCEILITPITDWPRSQDARSTTKEKMHPGIFELIKGCEDAMANPKYCDSGDFERLQWTTWYYQQRWPKYDWTIRKYSAFGWKEMSGDRIMELRRGKLNGRLGLSEWDTSKWSPSEWDRLSGIHLSGIHLIGINLGGKMAFCLMYCSNDIYITEVRIILVFHQSSK